MHGTINKKSNLKMKYTTENALIEIKRRAKRIRQKHERRVSNIHAACASLSLIALIAVIGFFSDVDVCGMQTEYGSFILPAETGKYALIAALGFVLGVCVALITKRLKRM